MKSLDSRLKVEVADGGSEGSVVITGESTELLNPFLTESNAGFWGDMKHKHVTDALKPQMVRLSISTRFILWSNQGIFNEIFH